MNVDTPVPYALSWEDTPIPYALVEQTLNNQPLVVNSLA